MDYGFAVFDERGVATPHAGWSQSSEREMLRLGYGFGVFDERAVATPYAGWSRSSQGETLRLGQRLRLGQATEWRLEGELGEDECCFSHSLVGSPRELVGVFRRWISWDDGVLREPAGAGHVAFPMNRCCRSGENVDARAPSVCKGWASAAHLSMPCPHGP